MTAWLQARELVGSTGVAPGEVPTSPGAAALVIVVLVGPVLAGRSTRLPRRGEVLLVCDGRRRRLRGSGLSFVRPWGVRTDTVPRPQLAGWVGDELAVGGVPVERFVVDAVVVRCRCTAAARSRGAHPFVGPPGAGT